MAKPVEHGDLGEFTDLFDLNVVALLRLMQLAIPNMRQQEEGQIVTICSQASTEAIPSVTATIVRLNAHRPRHLATVGPDGSA